MTTNYGERPGIEARGEQRAAMLPECVVLRVQVAQLRSALASIHESASAELARLDDGMPIGRYDLRDALNVAAHALAATAKPVAPRPERETHPRCNCGARIPMDCGDYCADCAADAANEDAIERAIAAKHGVTL